MKSVREATAHDVPIIIDLITELAKYERSAHEVKATPQHLHNALFCEHPFAFAHVVENSSGHVVGFALWFLNFSTWLGKHGIYLEDLYVKQDERGHGYGFALLAELARIAHDRGYGRIEWSVLDWNQPSIDFYKRLGAIPMDEWTTFRLTGEAMSRLASN